MALGKIRFHRDTLANKPATLLQGETYFSTDTKRPHIGNGDGSDWVGMSIDGGSAQPFTAMPYVGTAPIVESGSNANGSYIKFADGTMICTGSTTLNITSWTLSGSVYYYLASALTLPATFYVAPVVRSGVEQVSGNLMWSAGGTSASTATQTSNFFVYATSNSSGSLTLAYTAVGRWKA